MTSAKFDLPCCGFCQKKRRPWFGFVFSGSVFCFLGLVAILSYVWVFSGSSLSRNPSDWGSFGSYLAGVLGSVLAGLNVLALVYIAKYLTREQSEKQVSSQVSVMLLNHWNSGEMQSHRNVLTAYICGGAEQFGCELKNLSSLEGLLLRPNAESGNGSRFSEFEYAKSAWAIYNFLDAWASLEIEGLSGGKILHRAIGSRAEYFLDNYYSAICDREKVDIRRSIKRIVGIFDRAG